MKNKKLLLIIALLFVMLNLLIFMVFSPFNYDNQNNIAVFWISYVSTIVAFVLFGFSLYKNMTREQPLVFMGIPLVNISYLYVSSAVVVSLIFMLLAKLSVNVSIVLVIIIESVIAVTFVIALLIASITKDFIVENDEKIKVNVRNVRDMIADLELISDIAKDNELKKTIGQVAENLKYSDPMSSEASSEVEENIKITIVKLRKLVDENMSDLAKEACSQLELLIKDRNRRIANQK